MSCSGKLAPQSVSHLVQMDTGVNGSFGLVTLQVGIHSLLTHAHSGKHLADLLQKEVQNSDVELLMSGNKSWSADRKRLLGLPVRACDSLAAHWSAPRDRRSPLACNNTLQASPGYDPDGSTVLHSPFRRKDLHLKHYSVI